MVLFYTSRCGYTIEAVTVGSGDCATDTVNDFLLLTFKPFLLCFSRNRGEMAPKRAGDVGVESGLNNSPLPKWDRGIFKGYGRIGRSVCSASNHSSCQEQDSNLNAY